MKTSGSCLLLGMALALASWCRTPQTPSSGSETVTKETKVKTEKKSKSAGRDVADGTGNIAAGAGKAAGSAAKGGAKSAVDLVTLHPIDAGADAGRGAVGAGKDVAVGTAKGTGKIAHGIGKAIKHIF